MRSNPLKVLVIFLITVISSGSIILQTATSQAKGNLGPAALASKTVPIGANIKLPGVNTFSVTGEPAIAFDGTNFLLGFCTATDIYAMRVSQTGAVLDSPAILVAAVVSDTVYAPSVVFDGTNYLMVWIRSSSDGSSSDLYGARISPSGTVLDPGGVQLTTGARPAWWMGNPSLVWDGSQLLVAWGSGEVRAARFDATLANKDAPAGFVVLPGTNSPSVAFDGVNYLVAASGNPGQGENGNDIFAARVSPDGKVLDTAGFTVFAGPDEQIQPEVGFDGSNFLVSWVDYALPLTDPSQTGLILARRISPDAAVLDAAPIQVGSHVMIWGVDPFDLICDAVDCLLAWDSPSNPIRHIDIRARRILKGAVQDPQAIPVAATFGQQYWPVIGGGGGHYLVAWTENVFRDSGSYAQLLERQTVAGPVSLPASPPPVLLSQASQPAWVADNIPDSGVSAGIAFSASDSYAVSQAHVFSKRSGAWQIDWTMENGGPSALWASAPDDIWLTGLCMFRLIYNGATWNDYACKDPSWHSVSMGTSLWGSSPVNIWGTGVQGMLFRYDNTGDLYQPWILQPSGLPFDIDSLWGTSASNIYAVGERGSILHYDGSSWLQQASTLTIQRLNAVWGSGASDIFAVGDWGTILHFNGSAWNVMNSGSLAHLYSVWGNSAGNVYAVGSDGTILHYDGAAWSAQDSHTTMDLYSVWGNPDALLPVWAGGSGSQMLTLAYRIYLANVVR